MIDYEMIVSAVREKHQGQSFGGYDHIERVHDLSMALARGLSVDVDALRVAAYVHDLAVPVYGPEKHNERAEEVAKDLLDKAGVPPEKQKKAFAIIRAHTRFAKTEALTLEAEILRDADGIDYLGAVGIMRGVLRGLRHKSYSGDINSQGKKLLENLIQNIEETFATEKGKMLAKERIEFMRLFMEHLDEELSIR